MIWLTGAAVIVGAWLLFHTLHERYPYWIFIRTPSTGATPGDFGVPFTRLSIGALDAIHVEPPNARATLFICHGNLESISDWAATQKYLYDRELASFVFDYSGFGDSGGIHSVRQLRADTIAAFAALQARAPVLPIFGLGFSMGASVLLDALPTTGVTWRGVIIVGTYSSLRDIAPLRRGLPRWWVRSLPDVYNNTQLIARVDKPLLAIHSEDDDVVPVALAHKLFAAAPAHAQCVLIRGPTHREFFAAPTPAYWQPILDFIAASRETG